MAKSPSLNDVTNILNSATVINANNAEIESWSENTLSRDGSTPNNMAADIDMDSNDLLNVGDTNTTRLFINGVQVEDPNTVFTWLGTWTTATLYAVNSVVQETGSSYICVEEHTSGVFATDLADGRWEIMAQGANSGDLSVSGTLTVTGLSTFNGGFNSVGTSTVTGTLNVTQNVNITEDLTVSGDVDFSAIDNASTVRTDLGLEIGTDVQAQNQYLADIAGLTPTAGDLLYFNGTDFTNLGIGTARQGLVTNAGATAPEWYDLTSIGAEQATTSGTAIDITGFPAGANWVTLLFDEVSLSSNDNLLVQLGTSGGFVTTGYIGVGGAIVGASVGETSATNGVLLRVNDGNRSATGSVHFKRMNGDKWTCSYVVTGTTTGVFMGASRVDLGAEMTQLRLTRTGTNTFDNGAIAATWGF